MSAPFENPRRDRQTSRDLVRGVIALLEGMWADYLLHNDNLDRTAAKRVICRFVAALLPHHEAFFTRRA